LIADAISLEKMLQYGVPKLFFVKPSRFHAEKK